MQKILVALTILWMMGMLHRSMGEMELIFDMEEVGTGNNRGDSRKNELIRFYFAVSYR